MMSLPVMSSKIGSVIEECLEQREVSAFNRRLKIRVLFRFGSEKSLVRAKWAISLAPNINGPTVLSPCMA